MQLNAEDAENAEQRNEFGMMTNRTHHVETPNEGARAADPSRAGMRFGIAVLLAGALIFGLVAMVRPVLERVRYSEVSYPEVTNSRPTPILIVSTDAVADEVHTSRLEAGQTMRILLAHGDIETEFHARTIHVLITDDRGAELSRTTLSGAEAEELGWIIVGETVEYRSSSIKK